MPDATKFSRNHDGTEPNVRFRNDKGQLHNEDGPAIIRRRSNGQIGTVRYYIEGRRHREDGPAFVTYDRSGDVVDEIWYLRDKKTEGLALLTHLSRIGMSANGKNGNV